MAEMTAADHNIICELKLSARPDQLELLRHVLGLIEQQAQEIERMKCCGNCNNWVNRPEKMSCKIHGIDVAQWCRCGEWLEKEAEVRG